MPARRPVLAAVLGLGLALAVLPGCTALRVVTHHPTTDLSGMPAGRYTLDPHHASLHFKVMHLGYAHYVGRFDRFSAEIDLVPEAPTRSTVSAEIETASIDTNNATLEEMLRAPSMFDSAAHPLARFVSRELVMTGEGRGVLRGELTVKGRTGPVELAVTLNGAAPNPVTGAPTLGFSATGTLPRSAFGLGAWIPAVGDDVRLEIEAEFTADAGA